jgi:phosphoglycolate phosphatase
MSHIDAIIFDCDGVIFDSHSANLAYYNKILNNFSYPLVSHDDHEKAHLCHTACSSDVLTVLMAESDVASALAYASALDYRQFIPHMIPEPDLNEVLSELVKIYPLAVATNRGRSIEPVLRHFNLREFFSVVVTSHDVERPKPAPDMLLLASEQLNVKTENCLFIGDSDLDQRAAMDAAVPFIGFGNSVVADVCLTSHSELIPYLNSLC